MAGDLTVAIRISAAGQAEVVNVFKSVQDAAKSSGAAAVMAGEDFGALEASLSALLSSLDPVYAATKRLETGTDLLDRAVAAEMISAEQAAEMANRLGNALVAQTTAGKQAADAQERLAALIGSTMTPLERLAAELASLERLKPFVETEAQATALNRAIKGVSDEMAGGVQSAGAHEQAMKSLGYNLVNVGNVAIATRGSFVSMLSVLPDVSMNLYQVAGSAALIAAPIALAAGAAALLVGHAASMEGQLRSLTIALKATGDTSGVTAAQLQAIANAAAEASGSGRAEAVSAVAELTRYKDIQGQLFADVTKLAVDFSAVTGEKLAAGTKTLADALTGGYEGIRQLDDVYRVLSLDELQHLRNLDEQGKKTELVNTATQLLTGRFQGLSQQALGPAGQAVRDLTAAWEKLLDKLSNSTAVQAVMDKLTGLMQAAAHYVDETNASDRASQLPQLGSQVQALESQIAVSQKSIDAIAASNQSGKWDSWLITANAGLAKLVAQRDALYKQALDIDAKGSSASTASLPAASPGTTAGDQAQKDAASTVDAYHRIEREQEALINSMEKVKAARAAALSQGDTEAVAQFDDTLEWMRGSLAALQEPWDKAAQASRDLHAELSVELKDREILTARLSAEAAARAAGLPASQVAAAGDLAESDALARRATASADMVAQLSRQENAELAIAQAYGVSQGAGQRMRAEQNALGQVMSGRIPQDQMMVTAEHQLGVEYAQSATALAAKLPVMAQESAAQQRVNDSYGQSILVQRQVAIENEVLAQTAAMAAAAEALGTEQAADAVVQYRDRLRQLLTQKQADADQTAAWAEARKSDATIQHQEALDRIALLAQQRTANGQTILSEQQVADMRTAADNQFRQDQVANLLAHNNFIDGAKAGWLEYVGQVEQHGARAADFVKTGVLKPMEDALTEFYSTGSMDIGKFFDAVKTGLARLAAQDTIAAIGSALGLGSSSSGSTGNVVGTLIGGVTNSLGSLLFGSSSSSTDVSFDPSSTISDFALYADGGRPAVGKPAIVGERGWEFFVPDQPGTIIPHDQSVAIAAAADNARQWASWAAGKGRGEDDRLAHISGSEANLLKMLGGSGQINPATGLPEYAGGGRIASSLVSALAKTAVNKVVGGALSSVGTSVLGAETMSSISGAMPVVGAGLGAITGAMNLADGKIGSGLAGLASAGLLLMGANPLIGAGVMVLGMLADSLFGFGERGKARGGANIRVTDGRLAFGGAGGDNGFDTSGVTAEANRTIADVDGILSKYGIMISSYGGAGSINGGDTSGPANEQQWVKQFLQTASFAPTDATLSAAKKAANLQYLQTELGNYTGGDPRSGVNAAFGTMKSTLSSDFGSVVSRGASIMANIPALAEGGITSRPTLALIGDNPSGKEAVAPLRSDGKLPVDSTEVEQLLRQLTEAVNSASTVNRVGLKMLIEQVSALCATSTVQAAQATLDRSRPAARRAA